MSLQTEIINKEALSGERERFVEKWSRIYFQSGFTNRGEEQLATVHWRFFLSSGDELVSHVGLTEYLLVLDGRPEYVGAIGGLFTKDGAMGRGHASRLMDQAETFIFERLGFRFGILFCLPALVPFYARRGWVRLRIPVTLEQRQSIATWPEAAMIFSRGNQVSPDALVHVPIQPRTRVSPDPAR
jgi:GNAT superfamily N-acetyltransferase